MVIAETGRLSLTELRECYRRRELSPVEVTRDVLARIERLNGDLNAIVTVAPELALEAASAAEAAYASGEAGALAGVPFTVKDTIATRGVRTTMGSLLYEDWVPDFDPPSVQRTRAAGGVLLGKTNTAEFGWMGATDNRVFGPTLNPWDVALSPGGSGGGAAAAVAAGLGPVAFGTDAAGSTRIPASFCGVYGYKPSFGRIPVVPAGAVESLAHVGILSRTVHDAAALLEVAAGPHPADRLSLPAARDSYAELAVGEMRGLRVAWTPDLGYAPVDARVRARAEAAARVFESLGCQVEEVDLELEDPYEALDVLLASSTAGAHRDDFEAVRERLDPGRVEVIEAGFRLTAADVGAATNLRARFGAALRSALDGFDLLLTPATPVTAFASDAQGPPDVAGEERPGLSWSAFSYPFNLTGQPAASLPCPADDGVQLGLQVVGPWQDDALVLRASAAYEAAQPWAHAWPPCAGAEA